jgi:hypothetical protein
VLGSGFISNTDNLWRILEDVMDASWSVTKSMTKLTQCHGVWTSYRASYPTLRIYDEIWQFVMDAVWSMMKSENVMWISSCITRFLVVQPDRNQAKPTNLQGRSKRWPTRGQAETWQKRASRRSRRREKKRASLLTVQNRAQVHRKPTRDLVPFSPRGSSLDLSIQGSKANS